MVWSALYRVALLTLLCFLSVIVSSSHANEGLFTGQDAEYLKGNCTISFNEYRKKAGLSEIKWDDELAQWVADHFNCPGGFYTAGWQREGQGWGFKLGANNAADFLCAQMASVVVGYFAASYQYPGERLPPNACPSTKSQSIGVLFSDKIERVGCMACHNGNGDMNCVSEPNYQDLGPLWKDVNYKEFCQNWPGYVTGCDDAPKVDGCEYKGDYRTESEKSSPQSTDESKDDSVNSGSLSNVSSHDGSNSKYIHDSQQELRDSANVIIPGQLCIMLTIRLFI